MRLIAIACDWIDNQSHVNLWKAESFDQLIASRFLSHRMGFESQSHVISELNYGSDALDIPASILSMRSAQHNLWFPRWFAHTTTRHNSPQPATTRCGEFWQVVASCGSAIINGVSMRSAQHNLLSLWGRPNWPTQFIISVRSAQHNSLFLWGRLLNTIIISVGSAPKHNHFPPA